ncbi:group II intron reverse transcriptase/maturase [Priestia flexa]|uniref:Group II intron reverse transcriptase/maturase n=1 Tax=Priestia veravalensis TaxID=1414648 RepID=A0A0V8JRM9_9BACI|nr:MULTISPECIES: group II intron reverse transcriptase/maturase [Priestia]KSU89633.1 group II intron reverse transcriptase/maturase [Priestia veravalensis]SCB76214.1 group II intron reverse transcriptase/maturase [Priestia flexa]
MTDLMIQKLRNNEYFGMQDRLDNLYEESANGRYFKNLYDFIVSEENIRLAYRNIKSNTGSKTKGTNGHTIKHLQRMDINKLVAITRKRLKYYEPHSVKRVLIPKPNGDKRPLGIPTIEDRLIQQMFLQILEPIVEAKFNSNSFGFRPKRSTHDALARCYHLVNHSFNHYVVDVDIKGFFDNVNHTKLLKQLWTIGIRDKKVLSIIKKMLKAEVKGIGVPEKGTPQGGILSPLLANVVLNELDWWISNQWETKPTKISYKLKRNKTDALKKTKLKPMYLVRYADDFKIFTNSYNNAKKIKIAVEKWLQERLGLETSKEKSKITNIRKNGTDFLGVRFRAVKKGTGKTGYIVNSKMCPKSKNKVEEVIRHKLVKIRKSPTPEKIMMYNANILGMQNYYKIATRVSQDFNDIRHRVHKNIKSLLYRNIFNFTQEKNKVIEKFYTGYRCPRFKSNGILVYPMEAVKHDIRGQRKPEFTIYNAKDRKAIHKEIKNVSVTEIEMFRKGTYKSKSVKYEDNRLSKYVAQKGCCGITGERLTPFNAICHHKKPTAQGGTDDYDNLIIIKKDYHMLIHNNNPTTNPKYKAILETFDLKAIKNLNQLRTEVGNPKLS